MIKLWAIFFSFLTTISAQDIYENYETNSSAEVAPKAQSIFLSYEQVPTTIYMGELFEVKVKVIIANNDFEEISTSFKNQENIHIINPDAKWQWYSDNIFYNTFFMEANSTTATLPSLHVEISQNSQKIDSSKLAPTAPTIIKLNSTKEFSGVIAKSLKIKKYKTTRFDDESFIIVLEIEATQANLKEFKLKWVIRDGIDSSSDNLPYFKIYYYAIIPDYTKDFIFTYFNRSINKFEKISLHVKVADDSVSTQVDLNPSQNSLKIYKDIAYTLIGLMLLALFLKRRKIVYLLMLIVFIALVLYDNNILNSIKIPPQSKIQILPTKKSTVFYTTDRTIYVKKLDRRENYIKVLLPNGKIGWLDDSKN